MLDELLLQPVMKTCQHGGGCRYAPTWHFYLGCPHEHVARLDLCDGHAMFLAGYAGAINCAGCGYPMRIEIREKINDQELLGRARR